MGTTGPDHHGEQNNLPLNRDRTIGAFAGLQSFSPSPYQRRRGLAVLDINHAYVLGGPNSEVRGVRQSDHHRCPVFHSPHKFATTRGYI